MSIIRCCRSCKSKDLKDLFSLGNQAFTGIFIKENIKIPHGKLDLVICNNCSLVQLKNNFNLKIMYGSTYGYRTGLNSSMVKHIEEKAKFLKKISKVKSSELIIDIGSNDGTMLNYFASQNYINLIGIDPTINKFKKFYKKGIKKIPNFFNHSLIKKNLRKRKARIISSIAMFYDLPDPIKFAKDIFDSLEDQGIWHLEQSYSGFMLKNNSYDTICHEHLEYYSLKSIKYIFDKVNLKIIDLRFNNINGGSFAITVAKKDSKYKEIKKKIQKIISNEKKNKINSSSTYLKFYKSITLEKIKLIKFLKFLKKKNKIVIGYGASTKGNVILQFCKINSTLLKNICEVNSDKDGAYTPGSNIKIISEKKAKLLKPDYYLVLPWHFRKFIINKESKLMKKGTKFIFPLPKFQII